MEEINKSEIAKKEEEILKFWIENRIFEKTLEKVSPKGEFVFYDGPATANAKPVFHTMEPFAFKDIIPRYRTMRGYHVRRKGGWDTHGLPVELQIEKKLGFSSKKDIENFGIAEFNKLCRESVWEFIGLWKDFTKRMGYWADQDSPYITYQNSYIESLWNVLKTVEDKKLLYKDYKVLPWCPRCGTALSSHELAQGYQDDKDLSVTAKFKVVGEENTYILAWTTTPWTLPGNVALAVGEKIDYVKVKIGEEFFILAKERMISLIKDAPETYEILKEFKGKDLVGLSYEPLYPFMKEKFQDKNPEAFSKAYQVYSADFVNTENGTGVVHTAVMYGQDDFVLGTEVGLPKFHLVKDDGHFLDDMDFLSGRFVKDEEVAVDIIKDLAHRGLLFKKEKYEHSYPHCWRCKTPLIYYARDSWYIKMSSLRDDLVAENQKINWEPAYIKEGRFGEWLREIKDWAISRERYWGTPLPIWGNNNGVYKVVSGIEELKNLTKKSGNKYFVIRHGESEHNVGNILSTKVKDNFHLTEKGKEQVRESSIRLKKEGITKIISSPFIRSMETSEILISELGLSKDDLIVDDRLGEHDLGGLNGESVGVYHKLAPTDEDIYEFRPDGGESLSDVKNRVGQFLYETDSKFKNEKIILVSHEHTIWALISASSGSNKKETLKLGKDRIEYIKNAEILNIDFTPLPHNENYELDLHRPYIDDVVLDIDGKEYIRTKEVMDVWFDSGAMPFAQDNYPFSTKDILYPADYISEAIDQTRGWFYTLHAVGLLMGRGASFKNVICLGHILDASGKKMSKSLGNVVDPWIVMNKHGVDALRFWMYSVNQPGDSKNFDEKTVEEITRKVFNPLENIISLYELYKEDNVKASDGSQNVLDKWIISKFNDLLKNGTEKLDQFKIFEPTREVRDFVSDFSTWYIRRSRERLKSQDKKEKIEALSTTKFILINLAKYMAPFTPFFAERIYKKMEGELESVHLESWPEYGNADIDLLEKMSFVREIVTSALELRQKAGVKVRQPLSLLKVKTDFPNEFLEIIQDEVNVKKIEIGNEINLDTNITEELKNEGVARDVIRVIQDARKIEGLTPSENIKVTISCNDDTKKIIENFIDIIKVPTGVTNIDFVPEKGKYELQLDSDSLSLNIVK